MKNVIRMKRTAQITLAILIVLAMIPAVSFAGTDVSVDSEPEVIVAFDEDMTEAGIDRVVESRNDEVNRITEDDTSNTAVVDVKNGDAEAAVAAYEKKDGVQYACENVRLDAQVFSTTKTNDTYAPEEWYAETIQASGAWKIVKKKRKKRTQVAILDTGVYANHSDLKKNLNKSKCNVKYDSHGHGTHVTGIIAATANNNKGIAGVGAGYHNNVIRAYTSKITEGSTAQTSVVRLHDAIIRAADSGVKVINVSFGATGISSNMYLESAFQYAAKKKVTIVVSAGNYGKSKLAYPASCAVRHSNVIAVVATTKKNKRASYSCYQKASSKIKGLIVAAPGSHILSTGSWGDYVIMSGTSQSAPIVTGIVAMMYSVNPSMTPAKVKNCLKKTTYKNVSIKGAGLVNAKMAVRKAAGMKAHREKMWAKPAQVKKVKIRSAGGQKLRVSWTKAAHAKGYEIYVNSGNKYVKKATVKKSTSKVVKISAGYCLIKVRAYTKANGKKIYGKFSAETLCLL